MPNFNKSKGFQLRSGNKGGMPFKVMGSLPAKGWGDIFGGANKQAEEMAKQTPKVETIKIDESKNEKAPKARVMTEKESKMKQDGKLGTVVSRTAKKIGKGIKEGVKKTKEYIKENPQAIRDMGAVISNIGDPNTSMSSVIQGQADRKQERADKDIQNEKDKVSTERTQQLVDTYKKENSGEGELAATETTANPASKETAAQKVANAKAVKAGTKVKNSDGTYSPSSPAEYKRKK